MGILVCVEFQHPDVVDHRNLSNPPRTRAAIGIRADIFTTERYLQAEVFFLPVLRLCIWLLQAAIIHLGIRLAGKASDMDRILLIGGFVYLVVMPPILVTDWLLVAIDRFDVSITMYTHGFVALWSLTLMSFGLKSLLKIKFVLAICTSMLALITTIPLLMIFAR